MAIFRTSARRPRQGRCNSALSGSREWREFSSKRRAEKRKRIPPFSEAGHTPLLPDYRRNRVPGGTFFFTVNLLDRRSNLLVARIDALRDAVRQVRARAPFHIDAW